MLVCMAPITLLEKMMVNFQCTPTHAPYQEQNEAKDKNAFQTLNTMFYMHSHF